VISPMFEGDDGDDVWWVRSQHHPSVTYKMHALFIEYASCTCECVSQPHFGAKCENAIHIPKSGKMESSGTPKNLEDDLRGQISLPWCVLYINGKVLKCRCTKWPRMGHLDICSPSYGQKKGRESNCQFDSRPLKVRNRPLLDVVSRNATRCWKALDESYNNLV